MIDRQSFSGGDDVSPRLRHWYLQNKHYLEILELKVMECIVGFLNPLFRLSIQSELFVFELEQPGNRLPIYGFDTPTLRMRILRISASETYFEFRGKTRKIRVVKRHLRAFEIGIPEPFLEQIASTFDQGENPDDEVLRLKNTWEYVLPFFMAHMLAGLRNA